MKPERLHGRGNKALPKGNSETLPSCKSLEIESSGVSAKINCQTGAATTNLSHPHSAWSFSLSSSCPSCLSTMQNNVILWGILTAAAVASSTGRRRRYHRKETPRREGARLPPALPQKSDLFHISQPPRPSLPAPSHRHLRLTNSVLLLLPLPPAPLVSALEAPPHPAFLLLQRLHLHFSLFPDSKHTQPTSHLHSPEASPPAPALIGCLLPTSSSARAFLQSPLVTPAPPARQQDVQMWEPQLARSRARKGSIKSCHFLLSFMVYEMK